MGIGGAIPNKCGSCDFLFEGGCTRFFDELQRYTHLDYGPCGVDGATDPVKFEDSHITAKVEIPRKCAGCVFLKYERIFGFVCSKDAEKWGPRNYRGLDWGAWEPDSVYLQLPLPKVTTLELSKAAKDEDLVGFIKEYRRINLGLSIQEAKEDYARFQEILLTKFD